MRRKLDLFGLISLPPAGWLTTSREKSNLRLNINSPDKGWVVILQNTSHGIHVHPFRLKKSVLSTTPSLFLFAYSRVLGQRNSKQKYFRLEEPLSSMFIQFRPIGRKHFVKALPPQYSAGKHPFFSKHCIFHVLRFYFALT